jgi:DNA-binding NtrC family response regulator
LIGKRTEVRVLLVSGETQTVEALSHFMEKEAMAVEVCSDFASASGKLCDSKFEAVVLDFKEQAGSLDLLKKSRQMASHKAAVMIAILDDDNEMPTAFRGGANFVLVRPLSAIAVLRTLRASHPLMVRERRRCSRFPLKIVAYISIGSRTELMATSANISEGGIAITNAPALKVGEGVVLRLMLPGMQAPAKVNAEVCWRDDTGRAGMKFVRLSQSVKEQLASWLSERLVS